MIVLKNKAQTVKYLKYCYTKFFIKVTYVLYF